MFEYLYAKKTRRIVGLMSGTSVDGIDAALVEVTGDPLNGNIKLYAFEKMPFSKQVKNRIMNLFNTKEANIEEVGYMNFLLGELFAKAVFSVVEKAGLTISDIDFVGSHGQTIYHHPQVCSENRYPLGYTVQIGEGAIIAARTGVPCVSDFRVADMAVGGQGAPLVPFTEYILYRKENQTVLLQNIGGIGNITVLPAQSSLEDVYAFDTGPGNMIIDELMSRFTFGSQYYDEGGKIAAAGTVNQELLSEMCNNSYFLVKPPKSTGRELFGKDYCASIYNKIIERGICMEDAIATVTEFTAWSIKDSYERFIMPKHPADQLIIGGGGSYNKTLIKMIKNHMEPLNVQVLIQEDIGLSSDAKEAVAFAILADCTMAGKYNNLPSVTGAHKPVIMGKISL